jgi:redox-sensing transcriptional repressor
MFCLRIACDCDKLIDNIDAIDCAVKSFIFFWGILMGKKISEAVIKRLPRYYRYLSVLRQMGISRVCSSDLSKVLKITSSQVRQDFFNFGEFGLQGYGYDVELLHREISSLLGIEQQKHMIVIGTGSLGQAIIKHASFEKRGFKIEGAFDISPLVIGQTYRHIEVQPMEALESFVASNAIEIAVIATPPEHAREIVNQVLSLGIKAIWNFTSTEIDVPDDCLIESIHLSDSLLVMGYHLKHD